MQNVMRPGGNQLGVSALLCAVVGLAGVPRVAAQDGAKPAYESGSIETAGVRVDYLDFGGEGLPVLLTSGTRPAATWKDFAPRLTDNNRVIAINDRVAEGELLADTTRAQDILNLLDRLGFRRVVLMGNANAGRVLAYLGEQHPDRLAGLVFLGNAPEIRGDSGQGPSGAMKMAQRAILSIRGLDPDFAGRPDELMYQPQYALAGDPSISVPSLTFVNLQGTRGLEGSYYPLFIAEQVRGGLQIPDSVSRVFFERLASDESAREEVRAEWDTVHGPAILDTENTFYRAFDGNLTVVPIDVPPLNGAPTVTGYEYMRTPELIEPHVRRFLAEIR